MSFLITHRYGEMERDPPLSAIDALIGELDAPIDPEHPDVSVEHESGWFLSAFPSGLVVWDNVEAQAGNDRRAEGVSREDLRRLFALLAAGEIDEVESVFGAIAG